MMPANVGQVAAVDDEFEHCDPRDGMQLVPRNQNSANTTRPHLKFTSLGWQGVNLRDTDTISHADEPVIEANIAKICLRANFVGYIIHKGQFQAFRVNGSYRRGMTRGEIAKKVVQLIDEFLGKVEIMRPEHQAGLFGGPEGLQLRDLFLLYLEPVSKRGFDCVLGYRQPIGRRLAQADPRTDIQYERQASSSDASTNVSHGRLGTQSAEAIVPVCGSTAPILLIHALPSSWSPFTIGAGETFPTPHTLLTDDPVLRSRFLHLSRTTPNSGSFATTGQHPGRVRLEQGPSANCPQTDAITSLLTRGPVSDEAIYNTSTSVSVDPDTRAITPSYQYMLTSAMAGGLDSGRSNLAIEPSVTTDVLTVQFQGNALNIDARVDSHHSLYQHDALSPVLPRADQYPSRRESSPASAQCGVALATDSGNPTEARDCRRAGKRRLVIRNDSPTPYIAPSASSDILFQGHSRNSSWDSISSWV